MPLFYGLNSSQARKLIDVGPSPLFFRWGKSCPNDIWLVSNLFDPKMTSRFLSVKSWKPPVLISHVSLSHTSPIIPSLIIPLSIPPIPIANSIHSIHTSHHSFIRGSRRGTPANSPGMWFWWSLPWLHPLPDSSLAFRATWRTGMEPVEQWIFVDVQRGKWMVWKSVDVWIYMNLWMIYLSFV